MTRIFPRTGFQSGIESASKAARHEHDSRIGNGRYHLFRLPAAVESSLAAVQHIDSVNEELSSLLVRELTALLARLDQLVNGRAIKPIDGPISLGESRRLCHVEVIQELAACYLTAALGSSRSYPYFEPEREGL